MSLDRVTSAHPAYPLALFKRAQVSVLLGEPDREARIRLARDHADAMVREHVGWALQRQRGGAGR